tara:strand:+ start:909 stop:1718 length:810 start_codon:yes stop_codon:yes gene_type:complete
MTHNKPNKMVLLAGLPRTGSTLLQNLLAQNPDVYSEGNSGLCQIMWDAKISCEHNAVEQLVGVGKDITFKDALLRGIPSTYYPDVECSIILDKCRNWVNEPNIAMARDYISPDVRSIVMVRPIEEIVASFARVAAENNSDFSYEALLAQGGSLERALQATHYAAKLKDPSFLFVSYDELVSSTQDTMTRIYKHIGSPTYAHNVRKITQTVFEDDERNGMVGMHNIRTEVSKQVNEVVLPDWVKEACENMTHSIFSEIDGIGRSKIGKAA